MFSWLVGNLLTFNGLCVFLHNLLRFSPLTIYLDNGHEKNLGRTGRENRYFDFPPTKKTYNSLKVKKL